jgi:CheY-like chemotaxis protein/HPt (histidine-containing phosphotransfer) domain-containing protein
MDPPVRVLIVDDNPGDARLVEYSLTHEPNGPFSCARAGRIAAAVDRLSEAPFDVVLLDLGLPDSQGTEGLRRIRAKSPTIPIVVLTGNQNREVIWAAIAAGAQDYLVKGIFPKGHLATALRAAILLRQIENDLAAERPLDPRTLEGLGRVSIGVALFAPIGPPVINVAFSALTGMDPGSGDLLPAWLVDLVRVPAGIPARSRPSTTRTTVRLDIGEFALERSTGGPIALEYVIRRFTAKAIPRVLLFVREISADRRAPDRLSADASASPGEPPSRGPSRPESHGAPREVLDPATWQNLRELAGADSTFLPALVDAFLAESRRLVGGLQSAVDDSDTAAVGRIAHTLKSGCAQVGAQALSARCATLETLAESGNIPETRALIVEIARDFSDVTDALRQRYSRR